MSVGRLEVRQIERCIVVRTTSVCSTETTQSKQDNVPCTFVTECVQFPSEEVCTYRYNVCVSLYKSVRACV